MDIDTYGEEERKRERMRLREREITYPSVRKSSFLNPVRRMIYGGDAAIMLYFALGPLQFVLLMIYPLRRLNSIPSLQHTYHLANCPYISSQNFDRFRELGMYIQFTYMLLL